MFAINIENLKSLKYHMFLKNILDLSVVYSRSGYEYKRIFKERDSNEILKIFGLITNIEEYQKIYNHVWRKHKSRI